MKNVTLVTQVRIIVTIAMLTGSSLWMHSSQAQQADTVPLAVQEIQTLEKLANPPQRWLLVICGLPGDEEHRQRLTKATRQIAMSGSQVFGVADGQLLVLAGDQEMVEELAPQIPDCKLATAESVEESIAKVAKQLEPEDACWVFVLGHGNLYGKSSYFNLMGSDIDQNDFARMVAPLQLPDAHTEIVTPSRSLSEPASRLYWICTPVSGYWLRPLASPRTVAISATEAAAELTATEMPYALADVLSGEALHQQLDDIDRDRRLTLLDLYLAVNIEITARFRAEEFLQTEHAQLDDDGDGRGRELQDPYLPPDPKQTTTRTRRKMVQDSIRDGRVANQILLRRPEVLE